MTSFFVDAPPCSAQETSLASLARGCRGGNRTFIFRKLSDLLLSATTLSYMSEVDPPHLDGASGIAVA